jgi:hypothetical protein
MPGTNGYDGDELQRYLNAIDREDDELASLKGEYMERCKGPRSRIRDLMSTVREAEINMAGFRVLLKKHRSDRRLEQRVAALEEDDGAAYKLMREALGDFGDTELGQAALRRAKPKGDEKALESLAS